MYRLRKLCTSAEDYEAFFPMDESIELSSFSRILRDEGFAEQSLDPPQLTVIFERIGVIARIYPSGVVHFSANDRDGVEEACSFLELALQKTSTAKAE